jgi:hypothetical protein
MSYASGVPKCSARPCSERVPAGAYTVRSSSPQSGHVRGQFDSMSFRVVSFRLGRGRIRKWISELGRVLPGTRTLPSTRLSSLGAARQKRTRCPLGAGSRTVRCLEPWSVTAPSLQCRDKAHHRAAAATEAKRRRRHSEVRRRSIANDEYAFQRRFEPSARIKRFEENAYAIEVIISSVQIANRQREVLHLIHHACLEEVL